MAFVHVQGGHAHQTSAGLSIGAAGSVGNITAGNVVLVVVTWDHSSGATVTVSDTVNTFSLIGSILVDTTNNQSTAIYGKGNCTGGHNTVTATFSVSTGGAAIAWDEYSGALAATNPFDVNTGQTTASTTTPTSGNVTPTANNELIWGAVSGNSGLGNAPTAGGSFTIRQTDTQTSVTPDLGTEDQVQGTRAAIGASFTVGGGTTSEICNCLVVAVKAAIVPVFFDSYFYETQQVMAVGY